MKNGNNSVNGAMGFAKAAGASTLGTHGRSENAETLAGIPYATARNEIESSKSGCRKQRSTATIELTFEDTMNPFVLPPTSADQQRRAILDYLLSARLR